MESTVPLLVEIAGGVAELTLNRPEALNTLNTALTTSLSTALSEIAGNPAVRAVVLTGAGERAFCAGGDMKERHGQSDAERAAAVLVLNRLLRQVESLPQPVIAAIRGYALGGGLMLALTCDIRVAALDAELGLPEIRIGSVAGARRLTRLVGRGRASLMILTGRRVTGAEAAQFGVVELAVAPEQVLATARQLAGEIAAAAPLAVARGKQLIAAAAAGDPQLQDDEESVQSLLMSTRDYQEGLQAIRDRRRPSFAGE